MLIRALLTAGVFFASTTHSLLDEEYVKYALADGYVRNCEERDTPFGYEDELLIRRYIPSASEHKQQGTLYPFDQDPMSGWCGEATTGDRVAFVKFDIGDFDADAVGTATLRMTPRQLPPDSKVEVRAQTGTDWHDKSDVWKEASLTWNTAPFLTQADKICEWEGDEEIMHYDEPLTCDVTAYIKAAAGKIVGFTIDMVASEDSSREPVRFWSREMDDPAVQSIDYRGAPLSPDSARSFDDPPAAMESGEKDVFEVTHFPKSTLEYGTVKISGRQGETLSWRPHLLITGVGCGLYPSHSARDIC